MNKDMYSQFMEVAEMDNTAIKSVFMHLANATNQINSIKLDSIVISLKDDPGEAIKYDLSAGKTIPLNVYTVLSALFCNTSYLTDDIIVYLDLYYEDKLYNVIWEGGKLKQHNGINFLFENPTYFNFLTQIGTSLSNTSLFEQLFGFLIRKELPLTTENIFKLQFDKYYSGLLSDTTNTQEVEINNEILIETLLKNKNDMFSRLNLLTKKISILTQEKENLQDYSQNKEKYTYKYDSLKNDYKMLMNQSKTYFKAVNDLKSILTQISQELANVGIHLNMSNLPETERHTLLKEQEFLIEKKSSFAASLAEAEANFVTMDNMLNDTKLNMEATYNSMDVINHTTLDDASTYDREISKLKKELEDLYIKISDVEFDISKLQKENSNFNITREYAELRNKGTDSISINSLKSSLNTQILPMSINAVYKYLLNLFLYHCELRSDNNVVVTKEILKEFAIEPRTFFIQTKDNEVSII